jgi:protein TonB
VAPREAPRSPVRAAPEPKPNPSGSARDAGASTTPGTGTGSGGEGSGAGAGRGGSGTGGGGVPTRAQRIAGALDYRDYPGRRSDRVESVGVRFTVEPSGSVSNCRVTQSSGNARVDAATCRIIEQRFRYSPARSAAGEPVQSIQNTVFDWIPSELRRR